MSRDARPQGLSRRYRFGSRGAFGPVLRGARKVRGRLMVLHIVPGQPGISRFGIALTRRLVPDAFDRNRIKRIARDVFRRHGAKDAGLDCVIALRERFVAGQERSLRDELHQLLGQAARAVR